MVPASLGATDSAFDAHGHGVMLSNNPFSSYHKLHYNGGHSKRSKSGKLFSSNIQRRTALKAKIALDNFDDRYSSK